MYSSNFKLRLDLWPQIKRGVSMIMGITCLKYHHCIPEDTRVIAQKPLFPQTYSVMDRLTWWNQLVYLHNFVGGGTVRLILTLTILFYSILQIFYSILFYSVFSILYSILSCCTILRYVLLCTCVFYSIMHSILFYSILFAILFYSILFLFCQFYHAKSQILWIYLLTSLL